MRTDSERKTIVKDMLSKIGHLDVDGTMKRLERIGFFTAPASASYHGNYEGGLCDHSIAVARTLQELTNNNDLQWTRKGSPFLIGIFHDLCKCDHYVKTEDGFGYNKNLTLTGHGDKSVMLASTFTTLTMEEMLCIRYHMGAYETNDWSGFDLAIKAYPNVLFTHTADMLASKLDV